MDVSNKKLIMLWGTAILVCTILMLFIIGAAYNHSHSDKDVTIHVSSIDTSGFDRSAPVGAYIMTEEEFEEFMAEDNQTMSYQTYEQYLGATTASFTEATSSFTQEADLMIDYNPSITATGANAKLYNYCDKYFQCYYGDMRISPIFPLAIANIETGGRADNSITWSSLFPSRYVPIEQMDTFCVVDVLQSPSIYKALSTEWSTRDRGALQMSPTYGAGDSSINKRMSGTEVDKLKTVDTSSYTSWCSGASSSSGDRFYIPDVLLRLKAAMNYNIRLLTDNNCTPESTAHLLSVLATCHNSGSSVVVPSYWDRRVGNWRSGQYCYEWCRICSSPSILTLIDEQVASTNSMTIGNDTVVKILHNVDPTLNYKDYCTSSINAYYPIKFLYAYKKLIALYTK